MSKPDLIKVPLPSDLPNAINLIKQLQLELEAERQACRRNKMIGLSIAAFHCHHPDNYPGKGEDSEALYLLMWKSQ